MKIQHLIGMSFLLVSFGALADIVVVVHPDSGVDSLTQDEVQRIFLGKTKSFPNGQQAIPINQDDGRPIRESFNEKVCNKDSGQYRAYWSQLIFTGKGTPPKDGGDDAAVKALVAKNPNIVSYIDASQVDGSVKVVYTTK